MSGISIGWFDTSLLHPRPSELAEAIRRHFRLKMQKPLNIDVLKYEGRPAGAAYTLLTHASPIQIHSGGIDGAPNADVFTFVLEVSGRPALSAPFKDETATIWTGIAPPQAVKPLPLGMIELRAGMAVHFDPSANWHGYTSLPWDGAGRAPVPHAVLLQVGGYPASDIEGAILHIRTHDYGYKPVVLEPRPGQEPGTTDVPFVAVDDGLEEPSIFTVWLEQRADGTRYIYGEW